MNYCLIRLGSIISNFNINKYFSSEFREGHRS